MGMGIYLNPTDKSFRISRRSKIYVDKSGLISYLNGVLDTEQRFVCVSRPRRFGKSMAANMVAAYYTRSRDAKESFRGLKIEQDDSFAIYANQFDVVKINMQEFLSQSHGMEEMLLRLKRFVLQDIVREYPADDYLDVQDLSTTMADIYARTERSFVIVIDEWDCIFREYRGGSEAQKLYLDFLRDWLKDKSYIALAYMTGILPIKKYGTHSALNMFTEFSMENPRELTEFVGFTAEEVKCLCSRYHMDYDECQSWYDGYSFLRQKGIYNPHSVVEAMTSGVYDTYWNKTETYEALQSYINMNFDGLRDNIIRLLAGSRVRISTGRFANDMTTFSGMDDVLTLLVHLGYLAYDFSTAEVFIPNQEIAIEYENAIDYDHWGQIVQAIEKSDHLLDATLAKDCPAVANGIAAAHLETSHLQYNDENALSYTVALAYYSARKQYHIVREMPAGKGFADLVFLPREMYGDYPAIVIELKWDKGADTAIRQIREKEYGSALKEYAGKILLVGINYDKKSRRHSCRIEEALKQAADL